MAVPRIRRRSVAIVLVALPLMLSGFAFREAFPEREWDRWPDAVALAGTDPAIPVFVTSEAFALAFGHYCDQRFGNCPIRFSPVHTSEDPTWSVGLSGRTVLSERQAWSIGGPIMRTIEWDDVNTLFPQKHACSAADRSPAYRAQAVVTLGQLKVITWQRRRECASK